MERNVCEFNDSWSEEKISGDSPKLVISKDKTPNFNVQEKIKEIMSRPSDSLLLKRNGMIKSKKVNGSGINRGVSHKIRRPVIKKAKIKRSNDAKSMISMLRKVEMAPRLPTSRVPLVSKNKPSVHILSPPRVSLLKENTSVHILSPPGVSLLKDNVINSTPDKLRRPSPKFFTSRSQIAAKVQIHKNINLYAMNGEIRMKTRNNIVERKNIGRAIEYELEQKISSASLHSPSSNIKRLENARKMSNLVHSSPPKPTRFPGGSPSSKRTSLPNGERVRTPTRSSSLKQLLKPVSSPLRRSPRKSLNTASPYKLKNNRESNLKHKILETNSNANVDESSLQHTVVESTKSHDSSVENFDKNDGSEDTLQDLEAAFNHLDQTESQEDKILTSILKENQSPDKMPGSPRRSPRKHTSSRSNQKESNEGHSPKKGENVKYFPVFDLRHSRKLDKVAEISKKNSPSKLEKPFILKKSDKFQMSIDAGQKIYGPILCRTCGTLYDVGDPEDEKNHWEIHENVNRNLKFTGWKGEDQVTNIDHLGGRVIKVSPQCSATKWRKVEQVLEIVDADLGFSESGIRARSTTNAFLYILDKQVVGLLVVENIERAYEVIPQNSTFNLGEDVNKLICCSETPQKVFCGISRIWVRASQRRKKIASILVDAMRANVVCYYYLKTTDFAFSDPTRHGLQFAEKYTGKSNFLVYRREEKI